MACVKFVIWNGQFWLKQLSWAGRKRDNAGYPILFELMRSIPDLVERQSQAKVAGAKRKLGT